MFTFTFISQALIETPVIFAAIVSLLLISQASPVPDAAIIGWVYIAVGCTMGIGSFGSGVSSGRIAAAAAQKIALNPSIRIFLSRSSMLAQGLVDTIPIYAFIIALWLIFTPFV